MNWSAAVAVVQEEIDLQQPTQGELAELALVLLEEIWVAFKAGHIPMGDPRGQAHGPSTGSTITSFKRVLEAAHDMRQQMAPTFAPV